MKKEESFVVKIFRPIIGTEETELKIQATDYEDLVKKIASIMISDYLSEDSLKKTDKEYEERLRVLGHSGLPTIDTIVHSIEKKGKSPCSWILNAKQCIIESEISEDYDDLFPEDLAISCSEDKVVAHIFGSIEQDVADMIFDGKISDRGTTASTDSYTEGERISDEDVDNSPV